MLLQKFWQERWHIAVLSASQTFQKVTLKIVNFQVARTVFYPKNVVRTIESGLKKVKSRFYVVLKFLFYIYVSTSKEKWVGGKFS